MATAALAVAWLLTGCGGSSSSPSRLDRASARSARIVESDFASAPPHGTPVQPASAANQAKLVLLENMQARYGRQALPKAFDYCVAYRAGTEYPASGLARLSLPPNPSDTFTFGARLHVKGVKPSREMTMASVLGFSAGFQRVERRLATECDDQEATAFRSQLTLGVKIPAQMTSGITGQLGGFSACVSRSVFAYLSGRRLGRLLVLAFLRPAAGGATAQAAVYHVAIECLTKPAALAALRSVVMRVATEGLARAGVSAGLVSCFTSGLQAELTARLVLRLFALPASAFQRPTARLGDENELWGRITTILELRDFSFGSSVGKEVGARCLGTHA